MSGAETARTQRPEGIAGLRLVVMSGDVVGTHALPSEGTVTLGREGDVRVHDESLSRIHAAIHIHPPSDITVEDLGSTNGTRVRGDALAPRKPASVTVGEVIEIGNVQVIVQRVTAKIRARRVSTHGYFEGRLDEECAQAAATSGEFAVLRVRLFEAIAEEPVADALLSVLGSLDVLALYGPGNYEAILVDAGPERAEKLARDVEARLRERSPTARAGIAAFPRDGRTPEELMSHAESLVRGEPRSSTNKGFVAKDAAMTRLLDLIERVAKSNINVLIQGETGAGKEVIAGHLHNRSSRAGKPFVALNCASLPANLLESELFGHEKGAFTGALQAKQGLLETANGGTVLLDEIGETPLEIQGKLLRALEQREVLRVGAVKARPIDVRFLAATNRDLEEEIVKKAFRQDLYFRINGVLLEVPPLRERPGDVEALAQEFMEQACARDERSRLAIAPETLARLKSYYWPGNVRELRNVMDRAVLLCAGATLTPEHLPLEKMASTRLVPGRATAAPVGAEVASTAAPLSGPRAEEKQRIVDALAKCAGNQTRAAELLGISRRTLVNKLLEFGINRPRRE